MRASIAAALTAASIVAFALCLAGVVPPLANVAPLTLAFVAACVGVLAATEDEATPTRRRLAYATIAVSIVVIIVAGGLYLRSIGSP